MSHITELSDDALVKLADSSEPLTDGQKAHVEIRVRKGVRHGLRKYSLRATVGFLFLLAGVAYGFYDQNQIREDGRAAAREQRQAIVDSGNAVAVSGCNRDYRTALGVRRILDEGTRTQIAAALASGDINQSQAQRAIDRIPVNLKLYPLPDCRKAENAVTADPDSSFTNPEPFYPGNPKSPTLKKGEQNDTSKTQKEDSSDGP